MCVAVLPPFQITAAGNGPDGKSRRVYWSLRKAINSLMCDADGNGTMIDGAGTELSLHAIRVLDRQVARGSDAEFPLDRFDVPNGRGGYAEPSWAADSFDTFTTPGVSRTRVAS